MNPFQAYPFDFNTQIAMKAFQGVVDWVTGNTPITLTSVAKERVDAIAERYKIPVTVATSTIKDGQKYSHSSYVCSPLPEDEQIEKLTQLQMQLAKMPAAALQKINIKHIILCGNLEHRMDMGFLPDFSESLRGLNNRASHSIYLSAVYTFHHELFHQMWGDPNACDGSILSSCQDTNEQWTALEPNKTFHDPNEERADYARYLFNLDMKDHQEAYDNAMKEPGSRAKMNKVKNWLKVVDPRLDDRFWADLRAGKVNDTYWQNRK